MKPKLPCCEINKKMPEWPKYRYVYWTREECHYWECDHCECVFETVQRLDDHVCEIHQMQLGTKRKMNCCPNNEDERRKMDQNQCCYCECTFQTKINQEDHLKRFHSCSKCCEILLTDDVRAMHELKHKQEEQLERLEQQRQSKLYNDFVLNYLNGNKLDAYQEYGWAEPDFCDIFQDYHFENEELLRIVKKFNREFINALYDDWEAEIFVKSDVLIYSVENDALSMKVMVDLLDWLSNNCNRHAYFVAEILEYFLDKGYKIEPNWVAKVIGDVDDDDLIERIKVQHTFSFREIYETREWHMWYGEKEPIEFYNEVQRHFPDTNYEFVHPYEGLE